MSSLGNLLPRRLGAILAHRGKVPRRFTIPSTTASYNHQYRSRVCFSTSTPDKEEDNVKAKSNANANANANPNHSSIIVDASLRGIGQVIFLNSPTSAMIMMGGLAVGDPYLATLAATGTVTATTAAYGAGLDRTALQDGLWGYNGCLVGCAAAVFVHPLPTAAAAGAVSWSTAVAAGLATTIVGAGATPFVAASLKPALGSVPQFTLAFNMVTLSMLLRSRPLLATTATAAADGGGGGGGGAEVTTTTTAGVSDVILHAPWQGISQIFVVESTLTGVALVGGIAYYSRGLAAHTVLGSTIGAASGALLCGADMDSLTMGLWGFNSALTSLAVGVFFVHSPQAMMLSGAGAAATASIFGAMSTVFGSYGSPCLTLPFCLTMSGCYLLADAVPGLRLAQAPHSPEQNE